MSINSGKPLEPLVPSAFAQHYWFTWLTASLGSLLAYEILQLVSGTPQNTFSAWVWMHLKIRLGESITQWSAGDLLTFAAYIVIFIGFIPWHFWFGKFR